MPGARRIGGTDLDPETDGKGMRKTGNEMQLIETRGPAQMKTRSVLNTL